MDTSQNMLAFILWVFNVTKDFWPEVWYDDSKLKAFYSGSRWKWVAPLGHLLGNSQGSFQGLFNTSSVLTQS